MRIQRCPFCAETPRSTSELVDHQCRFIGNIKCSVEQWNTRLKPERQAKHMADQPELNLENIRSPAQIARDNLIFAMASAEICEPVDNVTPHEAKRHVAALKVIEMHQIQTRGPAVTVCEIQTRAENYRSHFEHNPTSNALAKWWRRCESGKTKRGRPTAAAQNRKELNAIASNLGLPPN